MIFIVINSSVCLLHFSSRKHKAKYIQIVVPLKFCIEKNTVLLTSFASSCVTYYGTHAIALFTFKCAVQSDWACEKLNRSIIVEIRWNQMENEIMIRFDIFNFEPQKHCPKQTLERISCTNHDNFAVLPIFFYVDFKWPYPFVRYVFLCFSFSFYRVPDIVFLCAEWVAFCKWKSCDSIQMCVFVLSSIGNVFFSYFFSDRAQFNDL